MRAAQKTDKAFVVDLLVQCFYNNRNIFYFIDRGEQKPHHMKALMSYAFDYCLAFGNVFLSEDKSACALVLYPERKMICVESLWQQLNLVLGSSGFKCIRKIAVLQKIVRQVQPADQKFHVWFMGVRPDLQGRGIGSNFLKQLIAASKQQERIFCLETSDSRHIPWLQKHGFGIYRQLDVGHLVYCLFHKDVLWEAPPFYNRWKRPPENPNPSYYFGGSA